LIRDFAESLTDVRVACDLGVGRGNDLRVVRDLFPSATCCGVDFADMNAALLEQQGVQLSILDLERDRLPFSDGAVDLVIANQVYEHLKEIFWVSHEVTRILPVGGHIIVGIPNISALPNRVLFAFGRQPSQIKNDSAHLRGFTPGELPRFFEACFPGGYKVRRFAGAQFYPFPRVMARGLCRAFPGLSHSVFYLFQKQRAYEGEFLDYPVRQQLETKFFLG
jgi:hypothetical protein